MKEKDYTWRGTLTVAAVVAVLVAVSFIPPQTLFAGVALRRANILSDLHSFDDAPSVLREVELNEAEYRVDLAQVALQVADTLRPDAAPPTCYEWDLDTKPALKRHILGRPDSLHRLPAGIPLVNIEDFGPAGDSRLDRFYLRLKAGDEPVRIAVLGDSFIEGDILTADLREQLQTRYGGQGAGFAPMASPLTGFRRTIRTQSRGWTAYNIMQRRNAPPFVASDWFVSGWINRPADGASVRWEGSTERAHLDTCRQARILFVSRTASRLEVTVNDRQARIFDIEASPSVRQIIVRAPIHSLTLKILGGAAGFVGYGATFEGAPDRGGVTVDNYSIRSNNGQALFWSNPSVNAQMGSMLDYDLVVLQYGLNILQQDVHVYTKYGAQVQNMIKFASQCFPNAALLVLSVSDRSVRQDGVFVPMEAASYLALAQRQAASARGAAFWSTYEAMRQMGGMDQFVASGWAGRDYTHINFAGGRRIGWALFEAIAQGVRQAQPIVENHPSVLCSPTMTLPASDAHPSEETPPAEEDRAFVPAPQSGSDIERPQEYYGTEAY